MLLETNFLIEEI